MISELKLSRSSSEIPATKSPEVPERARDSLELVLLNVGAASLVMHLAPSFVQNDSIVADNHHFSRQATVFVLDEDPEADHPGERIRDLVMDLAL